MFPGVFIHCKCFLGFTGFGFSQIGTITHTTVQKLMNWWFNHNHDILQGSVCMDLVASRGEVVYCNQLKKPSPQLPLTSL